MWNGLFGKAARKTRPLAKRLRLQCNRLEARDLLSAALVADINTIPSGSIPSGSLSAVINNPALGGNVELFVGTTATTNSELFRTDGTAAGTQLVDDIYPGPTYGSSIQSFIVLNNLLYFSANDGTHGQELWVSDGTTAGTHIAADIYTNSNSSSPTGLVVFNNKLFFGATSDRFGTQLWSYDPSSTTASLYAQINQNASSGYYDPIVANGLLFFVATDGTHGYQLWETDGINTPQMVTSINSPTGSSITASTPVLIGTVLYFAASDGTTTGVGHGKELWSFDTANFSTSNLTNNATRLTDIATLTASSSPTNLISFNGSLYFTATDGATGVNHGTQLYQYVPATSTTPSTLTRLNSISTTGSNTYASNFTVFNNNLYFTAVNPAVSSTSYFLYDLSAVGQPQQVLSKTGVAIQSTSTTALRAVGSTLYLQGVDTTHGTELWSTDGTAADTGFVADINPGTASSSPTTFTNLSGNLIFTATDSSTVTQLWNSNGATAANTATPSRVTVLNPQTGSSTPLYFAAGPNNKTYFFASTTGSTSGNQLWVTDGTTTQLVSTTAGFSTTSPNFPFGPVITPNGNVYFAGTLSGSTYPVYVSVPNPSTGVYTTTLLGSYGTPSNAIATPNGLVYFTSSTGVLYVINGTTVTALTAAFASQINYTKITTLGNEVFFTGSNSTYNLLEVSDGTGTVAGTHTFSTLTPYNSRYNLTAVTTSAGPRLFFTGVDSSGGGLWVTDGVDGTAAHTQKILSLSSTLTFAYGSALAANGKLYFTTGTSTTGYQAWASDGTAAGTFMLANIPPGLSTLVNYEFFTALGSSVYFTADNGANEIGLYKTDGSAAGTSLVKSFPWATVATAVSNLTAVNGVLYFSALDAATGNELWRSDGTSLGTMLDTDISPGTANSIALGLTNAGIPAGYFTVNGTQLFFAANDGTYGLEPWKVIPVGTGATTTTLTDLGPNSSTGGSSVSFSVTVHTSGSAPATGSITLEDAAGKTVYGTGDLSNGVATVSSTIIPSGTTNIVAVYSGDPSNASSVSNSVSQIVIPNGTSTTIQDLGPFIASYGQLHTVSVTVNNGATPPPTGTVSIEDASTLAVLATGTLSSTSGAQSIYFSTLPAGISNLIAVYAGDSFNSGSTSLPISTAQLAKASTATTLTNLGPNPSAYGQPVSFSITVSISSTTTTVAPTGTVMLENASNGNVLGSGTLSQGAVTVSVTPPAGSYSIIAVYAGDSNDSGSSSSSVMQVVNTTTTLTNFGSSPSAVGQAVSFTATVGNGSTTPATGTITLEDASHMNGVVGTGTLTAGSVIIPVSSLAVGSHSIIAVYGGDSSNSASTSQPISQSVGPTVASVAVNGGAIPQTRVTSLTVAFTGPVTLTTGHSRSPGPRTARPSPTPARFRSPTRAAMARRTCSPSPAAAHSLRPAPWPTACTRSRSTPPTSPTPQPTRRCRPTSPRHSRRPPPHRSSRPPRWSGRALP